MMEISDDRDPSNWEVSSVSNYINIEMSSIYSLIFYITYSVILL